VPNIIPYTDLSTSDLNGSVRMLPLKAVAKIYLSE
jgi:hypothetical protein